ncbi:hypothetical protein K474DRAFT_1680588 [Panus rudis PR-1116 ss-1]|nr:hypothetical protein K474DRAFT_1680588 [Panus rudis PR-1116 ss-1]
MVTLPSTLALGMGALASTFCVAEGVLAVSESLSESEITTTVFVVSLTRAVRWVMGAPGVEGSIFRRTVVVTVVEDRRGVPSMWKSEVSVLWINPRALVVGGMGRVRERFGEELLLHEIVRAVSVDGRRSARRLATEELAVSEIDSAAKPTSPISLVIAAGRLQPQQLIGTGSERE